MDSKWLLIIASLAMSLTLSGCSSFNQVTNLYVLPEHQNKQVAVNQPPKLGLALGGGGVRGFVHLGVFKALEEEGIKADLVTGTSAGSIAAAFYASGLTFTQMEQVANELSPWSIADIRINRNGFVKGKALADWVNASVAQENMEDMPIPIGIAVTNLTQKKLEIITQGNPGTAVQISSSIPGAFIPTQHNSDIYVDGGVLSVVPVEAARSLGAQTVIAVDIYCNPDIETNKRSILVATARLQACQISEAEIQSADVVIRPDFEPENMGTFSDKSIAIKAGYDAAKQNMAKIKALLEAPSQAI